jgi:branched-chain amino acid transport system permease protein
MSRRSESRVIATLTSLLVNAFSYGMVLFLISVGLTVTLGVMRVANLAHCGFAMVGGYTALALIQWRGLDLVSALPLAAGITIILGIVLERTLYRWIYSTSQLGQILMTIGLVFIMVATANLLFGSSTYTLPIPHFLAGTWDSAAIHLSVYRAFLVGISIVLGAVLWIILSYTDFGARLRASVDNPRMARCVGIDVPRVFATTFAAGCGLAAIGGVLGGQILPLDPWYALRLLVPVLMVVAVGGLGSLRGSFVAAVLLATVDTVGRYYIPSAGAFLVYIAVVGILFWRPAGMFAHP